MNLLNLIYNLIWRKMELVAPKDMDLCILMHGCIARMKKETGIRWRKRMRPVTGLIF